jgi:hypothetical protein
LLTGKAQSKKRKEFRLNPEKEEAGVMNPKNTVSRGRTGEGTERADRM